MKLREDVYDIKKELQEVKQESFAFSILSDYKRQNKRLFIALVIVLVMWFASIGLFIYYINTTDEINHIKSKIHFTPIQERIIGYRQDEYSITKMAMLEHRSESTINREIKKIKKKIMKVI